MTATEEQESEQWAFETFATMHPHECFAQWPDRFWQFFQRLRPHLSREQMEALLNGDRRGMTTAREIADWHRAEAKRLKEWRHIQRRAIDYKGTKYAADLTDRIKLHERFAAWLENV